MFSPALEISSQYLLIRAVNLTEKKLGAPAVSVLCYLFIAVSCLPVSCREPNDTLSHSLSHSLRLVNNDQFSYWDYFKPEINSKRLL